MLVMRWAGAKDWALRGSLGAAAKLTVDEHNGTFAKWKALFPLGGPAREREYGQDGTQRPRRYKANP